MQLSVHLYKRSLKQGEFFPASGQHTAIWVQSGCVQMGHQSWKAGDGFYVAPQSTLEIIAPSELICFTLVLEGTDVGDQEVLLSSDFGWPHRNFILRLDTVTFPEGAIAYRHVHAGAGIRYLARGGLEIQSDHHVEQMRVGDAWFEGADSPVKATAIKTETSQFIRVLVLPMEFAGKSTIKLLNPEDFEKPKLQENVRFFDQPITL